MYSCRAHRIHYIQLYNIGTALPSALPVKGSPFRVLSTFSPFGECTPICLITDT